MTAFRVYVFGVCTVICLGIAGIYIAGTSRPNVATTASVTQKDDSIYIMAFDSKADKNTAVFTPKPVQVIELSERNTLTVRGEISDSSVAAWQKEVMAKSSKLDSDSPFYVVLDTPGGSIVSGNQLIDTLHSIPQKVDSITIFAASMGFQIVQNLGERHVVPSGVLMSHRAKLDGIGGELPGELLTRIGFYMRMITTLDAVAASRMDMSLAAYQDMIRDEYWVTGDEAVNDGAADDLVLVRCDESMSGTTTQTVMFLMFPIEVTFSKCPVITAPLSIEAGKVEASKRQEAIDYVTEMFTNKDAFVHKHIAR
jgi:ATP-dependent protease ClpP protease subunit